METDTETENYFGARILAFFVVANNNTLVFSIFSKLRMPSKAEYFGKISVNKVKGGSRKMLSYVTGSS